MIIQLKRWEHWGSKTCLPTRRPWGPPTQGERAPSSSQCVKSAPGCLPMDAAFRFPSPHTNLSWKLSRAGLSGDSSQFKVSLQPGPALQRRALPLSFSCNLPPHRVGVTLRPLSQPSSSPGDLAGGPRSQGPLPVESLRKAGQPPNC